MDPRTAEPNPLEIRDLELWFPSGDKPALTNVNLTLKPGTVTAIIGPAGVGKSTLFKAILKELAISGGSIAIHGKEVKNGEAVDPRLYCYVPQKTALVDKLTVWQTLDLVAYARLENGSDAEVRRTAVTDVLQQLNMTHKTHSFVKDLSGGEERRVSIALELFSSPHLLMLDEPATGLDEGLDKELHETLRMLADGPKKPAVLFVTHSTTHLDMVDDSGRRLVDNVIAIGKAVSKDHPTATIRHYGAPGAILHDFGVTSYSQVMSMLRSAPSQPVTISTEKPQVSFRRTFITQSWSRSFIYNLKRQWLMIGKASGLLKSLGKTIGVGLVIAILLLVVSRIGLGFGTDKLNQEFLTYTSMLVLLLAFVGIVMPIMGIVMSWETMRREQRWGVSARSFVWAQIVIQMLQLIPAIAAATVASLVLTEGPTDQTLLPQIGPLSSHWQLFVLLLIPTLVSYAIGVLIGSRFTSSNTAIYTSFGVVALMLLGNGLIFTWDQFWAVYYPSFLIPSRAGTAMIASNFNAQLVMGGTNDAAFRLTLDQLQNVMIFMVIVGVVLLSLAMIGIKRPLLGTGSTPKEAPSGKGGFSMQGKLLPAALVFSAVLIAASNLYVNREGSAVGFGNENSPPPPGQTSTTIGQHGGNTGNSEMAFIEPQSGTQAGASGNGSSAVTQSWQQNASDSTAPAQNAPEHVTTAGAIETAPPTIPADAGDQSTSNQSLAGQPGTPDVLDGVGGEIDAPEAGTEESESTDEALTLQRPAAPESAEAGSRYWDIGGEGEPQMQRFLEVSNTQSANESCDLGGYQDWTKRPQQPQNGSEFAVITMDVTPNEAITISFCFDDETEDAWSIWLGGNPPTEFRCDSLHLEKPEVSATGPSIATWTVPAECVHADTLKLVFADTTVEGTGLWGILVDQKTSLAENAVEEDSMSAGNETATQASGIPEKPMVLRSQLASTPDQSDPEFAASCRYTWSGTAWVQGSCGAGVYFDLGPAIPEPVTDGCSYLYTGSSFRLDGRTVCDGAFGS